MEHATVPILVVQPAPRPYWQSLPCPSWCAGGHDDDCVTTDRNHFSAWAEATSLSLHDPEVSGRLDGSSVAEPRALEVYLVQGHREIAPRIVLGEQAAPEPYELTEDEAERLAQTLLYAVRIARSAR
jgi:hypothetical protein